MCCEDDYFPKGKSKLFNSLFHSVYPVFPKSWFSIADLFAVRYRWVVCNEDKCCVVTQRAADARVSRLVYAHKYCVPIATLNQNKRTRLLYLGQAQIIIILDQRLTTREPPTNGILPTNERTNTSVTYRVLSSCCRRNDLTTGVASIPCSGKGEKSLVFDLAASIT